MKWLRRLFGTRPAAPGASLWLEVQCARCGESIRVRVDPRYELRTDERDGREIQVLDKEIIGSQCYALIHAHLELGRDLAVVEQTVTGGHLVRFGPDV
jgi:hypothetical protein